MCDSKVLHLKFVGMDSWDRKEDVDMARKRPMTTEELFDIICKILKEKGRLPDILDYGLATHNPVPITNYEYTIARSRS